MIFGRAGSDRLNGRAGPDAIIAGSGADLVRAGRSGHRRNDYDEIIPGRGHDTVRGGPGVDALSDQDHVSDLITTGRGNDDLAGYRGGRDHYSLGPGDDTVFLWHVHGPDRVRCGPGHDRVILYRPARHHHVHDFAGCERVTD